jgi:hypothetical protein
MNQQIQNLIKDHLPNLLRAIFNHPPGRQHRFFCSSHGKSTLQGVWLRWWVANDQPFYDLIYALADQVPDLLNRYTVDEAAKSLIDVIQENLHDFTLEPFFFPHSPHTDLMSCSSSKALDQLLKSLTTFVNNSSKALFLFPVRLLRPFSDVVEVSFVWFTNSAPAHLAESLLQNRFHDLTFNKFPPFLDGDIPMEAEDSYLGKVAYGWQAGITALRRLAGAVCLILSYRDATLKSSATPLEGVVGLFSDGHIQVQSSISFFPSLIRAKVLPQEVTDLMALILSPKTTPDRNNRFQTALEFLALGLVHEDSLSFMNFFIAIDALFGEPKKSRKLIENGVRQRLESIDWKPGDRIGPLIDIRNDLLHGSCSSITTSSHYLTYRKTFQDHPLADLFRIVRECLLREPIKGQKPKQSPPSL